MLREFTIANFKCFSEFSIRELGQINIIAGLNNVGKTALLEALFLHAGYFNPWLTMNINNFRGIEHFRFDHEVMWGWLFHNHDMDKEINLSATTDTGVKSCLKVGLQPVPETPLSEGAKVPENVSGATVAAVSIARQLTYEYQNASGKQERNAVSLTKDGKLQLASPPTGKSAANFIPPRKRFFDEDAEQFDVLNRARRQTELVEMAKIFEPRLNGLSISTAWGRASIVADIQGLPELMPLPYAGEGMTRFVSILLRILPAKGGIVLIDEIENGFHHTVLPKVWAAIAETARKAQVQVFATTHSAECVSAAQTGAPTLLAEQGLVLHRLERTKGGIQAKSYSKEQLSRIIEAKFEVR